MSQDYEGKRKAEMPIPDFAGAGFFRELPMLESLPRETLEAIMALGAHLFLITGTTPKSAPRRELAESTLHDSAVLIGAACKIFAAKYNLPKKEVLRLVVAIINWLPKRRWTLHTVHTDEGGWTIFCTVGLKVIVAGGNQN